MAERASTNCLQETHCYLDWQHLSRPILGLAPMDGVTDSACRHIQKKYGKPALVYTEFVAVERLQVGDWALLQDLHYDESQRPVIAQIYGHEPERFLWMAVFLCELGFDGIDINMGCPAASVVHRGSGAGLIRTPGLAQEIVCAARRGIELWRNGATLRDIPGLPFHLLAQAEARRNTLPPPFQARRPVPVSVKTRIGYERPQAKEWISRLLEAEPAAIVVHGRTLHQRYRGAADWEEIAAAAEAARGSRTLILGNGDVQSYDDAIHRATRYGLDGVLIGRGANGNPLVFRPDAEGLLAAEPHLLLRIALEHAWLHEETISKGHPPRFMPMRKHLGWYARGFPGASYLRRSLVQTSSASEVEALLAPYSKLS
ncbi:MAG: tRNA-dihydrouridine synthase [Caldilinea sp.]|nr:tRNA-dihydrouridine synthase [Caldilinea sp.]MDW8439846.1 tRNA-dihydrouridine synthase [Caldilineaceae bacterium]